MNHTIQNRRNRKERLEKKRGFILLAVYLMVSTFSIFSLALFSRSSGFLKAAERNQNRLVAFNMAESGIDQALVQLKTNSSYTGTNGYINFGTAAAQGGYQVSVTTPDPIGNPNIRMVRAAGFSPSNNMTQRASETHVVTAYVQSSQKNLKRLKSSKGANNPSFSLISWSDGTPAAWQRMPSQSEMIYGRS